MISPGFEKLADCFSVLLRQPQQCRAAQVAAFHQGQLVADLAGSAPNTPAIDGNTPFLTFSVSKAFTAIAVMRLVEEGRLELDAPIGRYWPEFAQRGKEEATLRHALLHQAGIPAPHLFRQIFTWPSWQLVTRNVARETAVFKPGTQSSYHLVNFGFILGEVVRRVSGQPIDIYLLDNFFKPMGLKSTWMRIPRSELRNTPRLIALSPSMRGVAFLFNQPIIRSALIPAAGLHSNARELAIFFQMLLNGGEDQGRRYLKPETIALAAQSHYEGYDQFIKAGMNWGLGLIMGGGTHLDPDPRLRVGGYGGSTATFAALGMGTCMVWADRREKLVVAFTANAMLGDTETAQRWADISNAVWDCLPAE